MSQRLSLAILCGFLITVAAFVIGFSSRSLQRIGDFMLAPGYWLPEAYWGGVHDPLQLTLAVSLNVILYGAGVYLLLGLRGRRGQG